tara:strand:+ start:84 stop:386 length:303 start_codon:yes stop_codon:yes gene_type:complete
MRKEIEDLDWKLDKCRNMESFIYFYEQKNKYLNKVYYDNTTNIEILEALRDGCPVHKYWKYQVQYDYNYDPDFIYEFSHDHLSLMTSNDILEGDDISFLV